MSKLILVTILQALMVSTVAADTSKSLQHISKRPYASPSAAHQSTTGTDSSASVDATASKNAVNSSSDMPPSLNLWMLGSRPYLAPSMPMTGDGD